VFAGIPHERAQAIARRIEALASRSRYLVPSHDPADPRFDGKRYWRGPVWLIVNHLISDGLAQAGQTATAEKIIASSLDLIKESGFAEYYDPQTGAACGGKRFTWTAAMVLEFLLMA
jgi:glycogen debranching enzyme